MRRLLLGSLVIALVSAPAAQAPVPAELRFEVASVKPNRDRTDPVGFDVRPDGLWFRNLSLQEFINFAHDLGGLNARGRIVGGPPDLLSERFTIEAKAAERVTAAEVRDMLRTLLAERFNLKAHMETRNIPVFALTRVRSDRLGRDLQRSQAADCVSFRLSIETLANLSRAPRCPRSSTMEASGAINKVEIGPMSALIVSLEEIVTSRPIVDATGLAGMFEWRLRYQLLLPDPDSSQAPSVFDAVHDQLGLRLEPRDSPFEVLVIDNVTRPTLD